MRKLALIGSVLIAACSHSGHGEGALVATAATTGAEAVPEGNVEFRWTSGSDETQGQIRATLPGGRTFSGEYLQLRADVVTDTTGPHIAARTEPAWARDPWFGGQPQYDPNGSSDKVVAHLTSPDGTQMRCRFVLASVSSDIQDGGRGTCELSDHEEVVAATLVSGR